MKKKNSVSMDQYSRYQLPGTPNFGSNMSSVYPFTGLDKYSTASGLAGKYPISNTSLSEKYSTTGLNDNYPTAAIINKCSVTGLSDKYSSADLLDKYSAVGLSEKHSTTVIADKYPSGQDKYQNGLDKYQTNLEKYQAGLNKYQANENKYSSLEKLMFPSQLLQVDLKENSQVPAKDTLPPNTDYAFTKPRIQRGSDKRIDCPECGKSLAPTTNLNEHMRTHTGEKPYTCDECGAAFASKSNLRCHKRLHTGERPYMCGICGKTFAQSSHLPGHMRIHTGEKPYQCNKCDKAFTSDSTLTKHLKIHEGDCPFICEICDRAFVCKSWLNNHYKVHSKDKPFKCNVCGKGFKEEAYIEKHKLKKICSPDGGKRRKNSPKVLESNSEDEEPVKRGRPKGSKDKGSRKRKSTIPRKVSKVFKTESDGELEEILANHEHNFTRDKEEREKKRHEWRDRSSRSKFEYSDKDGKNAVKSDSSKCNKYDMFNTIEELEEALALNYCSGKNHKNHQYSNEDQSHDQQHHQPLANQHHQQYQQSPAQPPPQHNDPHVQHSPMIPMMLPQEQPPWGQSPDSHHPSSSLHSQINYQHSSPYCLTSPPQLPPSMHMELSQQSNNNINTVERIKCPECGKSLSANTSLTEHMRTHTGEKPFSCDDCNATFASKSNLRCHKRLHTGERPYMCGICGKTFAQSSHLPLHMRVHSNERPYKCTLCEMSFKSDSTLVKHIKIHNGDTPYVCKICNRGFVAKSWLQNHCKVHIKDKPFKCERCGKGFKEKTSVAKHQFKKSCLRSRKLRKSRCIIEMTRRRQRVLNILKAKDEDSEKLEKENVEDTKNKDMGKEQLEVTDGKKVMTDAMQYQHQHTHDLPFDIHNETKEIILDIKDIPMKITHDHPVMPTDIHPNKEMHLGIVKIDKNKLTDNSPKVQDVNKAIAEEYSCVDLHQHHNQAVLDLNNQVLNISNTQEETVYSHVNF